MKKHIYILFFVLLQFSCSPETKKEEENIDIYLNPFPINLHSDTLNFTGPNGKKHGIWMVDGKKVVYKNDTAYSINEYTTVEELAKMLNDK